MRLPTKDSATYRGAITSAQGFLGAFWALAVSLWAAISVVPGCPEAVLGFVKDNLIYIAAGFGVSSGTVSLLWNIFFRKDVKNY